AIFGLGAGAGSTNLGEIVARTLAHPGSTLGSGHLMAFAALFIVMLAECGRLPVDNPATHLELTMIHEAMILEYSGPYLALVEWAAQMKVFLFLSLLSNLVCPWGVAVELRPRALGVLWRHSLAAYIRAFARQSFLFVAAIVLVAAQTGDGRLYLVAALVFLIKVVLIPNVLQRVQRHVGADFEIHPYVNTPASLV